MTRRKTQIGILLFCLSLATTGSCSDTPGKALSTAVKPAGKDLWMSKGCNACHSINGQPGVGPTFKGLFGKKEFFMDGSSLEVNEAYLVESIRKPNAKITRPYQPVMPVMPVTDEELSALVEFIKSLK